MEGSQLADAPAVRRSASATLSTVQAWILLMYVVYNVEGYSPKIRSMLFTALAMAKELGLHRTDASNMWHSAQHADRTERETRRRVWWALAAIDW